MNASSGDVNSYLIYDGFGSVKSCNNGVIDTVRFFREFPFETKLLMSLIKVSTGGGPTKITSTAGLVNVFEIDGAGTVYQKNGISWVEIPGKKLKQVDVSLSSSNDVQLIGVDAAK